MGARLPLKPPPAAPMHMLTKAMRKLMTVGCWYSSCLKVTSCSGCNHHIVHRFSTNFSSRKGRVDKYVVAVHTPTRATPTCNTAAPP